MAWTPGVPASLLDFGELTGPFQQVSLSSAPSVQPTAGVGTLSSGRQGTWPLNPDLGVPFLSRTVAERLLSRSPCALNHREGDCHQEGTGSPVSHAVVHPVGGADPLIGRGPVVQAGVQVQAVEQVGCGPDDPARRHWVRGCGGLSPPQVQ